MLSLEEAQEKILGTLSECEIEQVPIAEAGGRILRADMASPVDLPGFDNSAMDGYAVRADDLVRASAEKPASLKLIGKVAAGKVFADQIFPGSCVRLFTGSPLPKGADAVVMQEDTKIDSQDAKRIIFSEPAKPWENIRLRGEDIRTGAMLVRKGERLTPAKLALLAATGAAQLSVSQKPLVGIMATGGELREPGEALELGQVYESNRLLLKELVAQTGCEARVYPIVSDTLKETRAMLKQAFTECAIVISTGGVSVGEFDFIKSAFEKLDGTLDLWQIALRPGKPFVFGQRKKKFLFGLPGNPVSTAVTFYLLVRPALLKVLGASQLSPASCVGVLAQPLVNRTGRRHFMRARMTTDGLVHSAGTQGSHMLASLSQANGLVDVPPEMRLEPGTKVKVLLWDLPA
jgi:molybdopterin molybdotransferase